MLAHGERGGVVDKGGQGVSAACVAEWEVCQGPETGEGEGGGVLCCL